MTSGRVIVAAVVVLVAVAGFDAVRSDGRRDPTPDTRRGYVIDLTTSRAGTWLPPATVRRAFPRPTPKSIAISKVAVADDVTAVAVSHVPGGEEPARAAIEVWEGEELRSAFSVPVGSFSLGMWFADDGDAIATIGWDERGYLYDRLGRKLRGEAYFAYETG